MQTLALPNYTSLPELADCQSKFEARSILENGGGQFLDEGSFSHVYRGRGGRVIKLTKPDAGSEATLEACLELPDNPHLPTVYGFVRLPDGSLVVEVEELEPISRRGFREFSEQTGLGSRFDAPDLDDCAEPAMREALALLTEKAEQFDVRWDDHDGNVMVRPSDGKVVLTDLLYSPWELHGDFDDDDWSACDLCGSNFDIEAGGGHVDGEAWCDRCISDRAVHCDIAKEWFASDEDDAATLGVIVAGRQANAPWLVQHGHIAAHNRAAAEAEGYVWDGERYVEANLYAVLTAISGIAAETLAQNIEPRLPFSLAA